MENKNLKQAWQYVEKWAVENPDGEALVFENERLTWADFKENMDRVALALLEIGIEKGDCVAMLAMARNEFMHTYMASGKIGAMWLGLNPKFSLEELRYQLGDSKPKVLIMVRHFMDKDMADDMAVLLKDMPFIKKILVLGESFEGAAAYDDFVMKDRSEFHELLKERSCEVLNEDLPPLLMYTSGSTGRPKGVVQTHRSIVSNVEVMIDKLGFYTTDRMLVHFPINHVASDVEIGLSCVVGGGTLIFMDKFDPVASMDMILEEKITILGQVPVMYLMQMQTPHWKQPDWYKSIRAFVISGAIPPAPLIEALRPIKAETGCLVYNAYGSTEACGLITYTHENDSLGFIAESIGKVPAPMEVRLVDDDRQDVKQGEIGEIIFKGVFLFKEYLHQPEMTAEAFSDGWFYSKDLAYADEDGNLFMVGRKSEMYKTGGENVFPREIEAVLESHPSVLFSAIIAVPDELYQEVGWAYIMLKPGQTVEECDLRNLCQAKLANFKVPKKIVIRQMLPLLPTGKVNKVALKNEQEGMAKA